MKKYGGLLMCMIVTCETLLQLVHPEKTFEATIMVKALENGCNP